MRNMEMGSLPQTLFAIGANLLLLTIFVFVFWVVFRIIASTWGDVRAVPGKWWWFIPTAVLSAVLIIVSQFMA